MATATPATISTHLKAVLDGKATPALTEGYLYVITRFSQHPLQTYEQLTAKLAAENPQQKDTTTDPLNLLNATLAVLAKDAFAVDQLSAKYTLNPTDYLNNQGSLNTLVLHKTENGQRNLELHLDSTLFSVYDRTSTTNWRLFYTVAILLTAYLDHQHELLLGATAGRYTLLTQKNDRWLSIPKLTKYTTPNLNSYDYLDYRVPIILSNDTAYTYQCSPYQNSTITYSNRHNDYNLDQAATAFVRTLYKQLGTELLTAYQVLVKQPDALKGLSAVETVTALLLQVYQTRRAKPTGTTKQQLQLVRADLYASPKLAGSMGYYHYQAANGTMTFYLRDGLDPDTAVTTLLTLYGRANGLQFITTPVTHVYPHPDLNSNPVYQAETANGHATAVQNDINGSAYLSALLNQLLLKKGVLPKTTTLAVDEDTTISVHNLSHRIFNTLVAAAPTDFDSLFTKNQLAVSYQPALIADLNQQLADLNPDSPSTVKACLAYDRSNRQLSIIHNLANTESEFYYTMVITAFAKLYLDLPHTQLDTKAPIDQQISQYGKWFQGMLDRADTETGVLALTDQLYTLAANTAGTALIYQDLVPERLTANYEQTLFVQDILKNLN